MDFQLLHDAEQGFSSRRTASMPQQHTHEGNHVNVDYNDDHHHHNTLDVSSFDIVDTVVRTAKICNTALLQYCTLCTVYIDQQVQYELLAGVAAGGKNRPQRLDSSFVSLPLEDDDHNNDDDASAFLRRLSAELHMFDEDSVVESVEMRQ